MATVSRQLITPAEYLERERRSTIRSEYFAGEVFPMSGGSREHSLIEINCTGELRAQLKAHPCEVHGSNMRVKVTATGLYTYPDAVVVCGEPQFEDATVDTLLNPILVIEVLSDSTEDYDRGGKFEQYRSVPSLKEYILISQHEPKIEQYVREHNEQWRVTYYHGLNSALTLSSIPCVLPFAEIYAKVKWTLEVASEAPAINN